MVQQRAATALQAMRNWILQGSNDVATNDAAGVSGATWDDIDTRVNDTSMSTGSFGSDAVYTANEANTTPYRWFRIINTGLNASGTDNNMQLSEIEFYGEFEFAGNPDVVASIVIDNPGYGYLTEPSISFTGDGTDAAATAVLEALGYVDSVVIDDPGVFTATPDITFDGDGTGATGTANLAVGGSVIEVNVTDPGTNYQSAPDVSFEPVGADPGTGAAGTASIEGEVTGFTVTDGGSGYDTAPSVEIPGAAAATANIAGGEVVSLTLTNPGSGYAAPPPVVFFALGGPEGVATIAFGVNNISVTNGGSGYAVEPPVEIVGDGRSASARAILGRSLLAVEVISGGDNYASNITLGISAPGGNGGAAGTIQRSFGIESATVSDGGSGYTSDPEVTAPAPAGGIDAIFQAIRGLPIREVVMTNPGAGYTTPPTVGFADPFPVAGTPAAGDAILGFGVASVAMDTMGSGYQTAPMVELRSQPSGGGGATAIAELLGRSLASIFVDAGGSGYTSPPTVIVGDGSNATAHAVLTGDVVTSIVVDTPGSGYQAAPEIHILNDGGGTGAHGQAVLTANQDMRIVVTNPGAGYEDVPDVILTGGGGTGATATATLTTEGGVKRVELSEEGTDYTTDTPVAFTGGSGSGAAGTATRDLTAAGPVALIAVLQAGSGYIAATVNLVFSGGGGTDAAGTAVKKTLGSIKSITLTNTGSGFEAPPVAAIGQAFGGLGTGAVLRAILAPTGRVKRVVMTSAGEGYTEAPTVSFPATDGSGAAATAFLMSTGSIETLTLTVPGGPFSVAPLVSFLPTGNAPLATALYLLAQIWPTLVDEITDPTDKLIVVVTKDIVPKGTPIPSGYSEGLDLNKYRRIQIVSKLDLTRLPPPETYLTTQNVGLPNQLLAVTPVWSTRIARSTAINQNHSDGSASAAAEISGSILVLKTGGFRGAAISRVQRVHFNGVPPDAAVPEPTIIRPSTGTAFIKGGANSVARAGSPNGPVLNFYGQPAQIGDLMGYNPIDGLPYFYAGGLGLSGPNITTSSSSSISSNLQIVDISDVLTAGINLATVNGVVQESGSGDPGALDVEASVEGTFGVSMPASCPASLQPGSTILQEVGVEKRRFNLYVRTFVYVIVPGQCEAVGGGS